ncbi:MAG TPA: GntR family transcriptional regulator [Pseudonocardiaceae bacterium]|jgi:GntR family transcriptional regulator|nr:GntR family transcriptional regulator [Pseudonocardiaceae bacterium]
MTAAPIGSGPARRTRADRARQVADVLRQQVVHGAFPKAVLPEERLLTAEFGVSRNTVREALDVLREEGLIDRLPGVGTVVRNEKYTHGIQALRGLNETLCEHGEVSNEVRAAGLVRPPATVAGRLRVPEGETVVYVERLRSLGGLPLSLDLTYLVRDIGEPLLAADLAGTDIFTLIERVSGQGLGTAQLQLEAVNADAHSAALLAVPKGAALLVSERLTHLDDGRPIDLEYIRFRGDRLIMSAELLR